MAYAILYYILNLHLQLDASKYSWKCSIPISLAPLSNRFVNICLRLNKLNTKNDSVCIEAHATTSSSE